VGHAIRSYYPIEFSLSTICVILVLAECTKVPPLANAHSVRRTTIQTAHWRHAFPVRMISRWSLVSTTRFGMNFPCISHEIISHSKKHHFVCSFAVLPLSHTDCFHFSVPRLVSNQSWVSERLVHSRLTSNEKWFRFRASATYPPRQCRVLCPPWAWPSIKGLLVPK
jgi:hypothetical protein